MSEENKDVEQIAQPVDQITQPADQDLHKNQGSVDQDLHKNQGQETAETNTSVPNANVGAKNFRTLREQKERAERERDEVLRRLDEYEKAKNEVLEEDDEINLGPDDFAEGKHLTKFGRKIKKLEQALLKQKEESKLLSTETRLKSQYPDFDKVVSKENIESLKKTYPEIAQTLNNDPDVYSKAVSAYTLIKKLGVIEGDYSEQKDKIIANSNKPRPLTSVSPRQGDSPLHKANAFSQGLTKELKQQLYEEMIEARKNY